MDSLDFSEDEIRDQLAILGYQNIPEHRLREFKRDLDELIRRGKGNGMTSTFQRISSKSATVVMRPSPPAYIKEKVCQTGFEDSARGFFLHGGRAGSDRLLSVRPNGDSYARHSVAPKLPLPPGAPGRLQVEPDPDDTLPPPLSDSCASTPDTQGRRFIRRKVLRKRDGESLVCDESVYSEESDTTSVLEERLEELRLSPSDRRDLETEDEDMTGDSDEAEGTSTVTLETRGTGVVGDVVRGRRTSLTVTRNHSSSLFGQTGARRDKAKSFIRPVIQTTKKTDPVAKYFQYKQFWEMFKLPGETDRRALRLEVKERLEYQPPLPKPRRVFVPNSYVVPTEKKRSALRWQIRNDLAGGLLPCNFSYHHFY
ncbi:centriolar and ciliogenesis-associated protein HYLS1 [Brachionichthys hirsutus]|uniref:centriolar and ciliogenesis-associated protein HYLS1 n=1 Tax=Brachionichthys hirsutus TaxID=412623 RepID=UPI0036051280